MSSIRTAAAKAGMQAVAQMWKIQNSQWNHQRMLSLISTLFDIRYAKVTNSSDKVYGIPDLRAQINILPGLFKVFQQFGTAESQQSASCRSLNSGTWTQILPGASS